MMNGSWLRCEVETGMLPGEFAVAIQTSGGKVSLFAPSEKVKQSAAGTDGLLQVELIDENAEFGLVKLPRTPMDGSQVVRVARAFLQK
jgi:hypothetical protein